MKKNNMDKLEKIIMKLRSDDGCPWDQELTLEKLGQLTVEEAYELLDAVEKKDTLKIVDELSDILTHLIFYFQIGDSLNQFSKDQIIDNAYQKLISRHPHVFDKSSKKKFNTAEEVEQNWSSLKGEKNKILENLKFNGPSGISAERMIKKMLEFEINLDEKNILDTETEYQVDLLFNIYFQMIQNGKSPEAELRMKLSSIREKLFDLEKKERTSFENLDRNKIKKILFPE